MSSFYTISGTIHAIPGKAEELAQAIEDEIIVSEMNIDVIGDDVTFCLSGFMSGGSAESIDEDLKEIAGRLAAKPSVLNSEFDNDQSEVFVGPEGFSAEAAELESVEQQIAALMHRASVLRAEINQADGVTTGENPVWLRDDIQFPRLICEIVATQELDFDALSESMDLTKGEIDTLFDRANNAWEAAKQSS